MASESNESNQDISWEISLNKLEELDDISPLLKSNQLRTLNVVIAKSKNEMFKYIFVQDLVKKLKNRNLLTFINDFCNKTQKDIEFLVLQPDSQVPIEQTIYHSLSKESSINVKTWTQLLKLESNFEDFLKEYQTDKFKCVQNGKNGRNGTRGRKRKLPQNYEQNETDPKRSNGSNQQIQSTKNLVVCCRTKRKRLYDYHKINTLGQTFLLLAEFSSIAQMTIEEFKSHEFFKNFIVYDGQSIKNEILNQTKLEIDNFLMIKWDDFDLNKFDRIFFGVSSRSTNIIKKTAENHTDLFVNNIDLTIEPDNNEVIVLGTRSTFNKNYFGRSQKSQSTNESEIISRVDSLTTVKSLQSPSQFIPLLTCSPFLSLSSLTPLPSLTSLPPHPPLTSLSSLTTKPQISSSESINQPTEPIERFDQPESNNHAHTISNHTNTINHTTNTVTNSNVTDEEIEPNDDIVSSLLIDDNENGTNYDDEADVSDTTKDDEELEMTNFSSNAINTINPINTINLLNNAVLDSYRKLWPKCDKCLLAATTSFFINKSTKVYFCDEHSEHTTTKTTCKVNSCRNPAVYEIKHHKTSTKPPYFVCEQHLPTFKQHSCDFKECVEFACYRLKIGDHVSKRCKKHKNIKDKLLPVGI